MEIFLYSCKTHRGLSLKHINVEKDMLVVGFNIRLANSLVTLLVLEVISIYIVSACSLLPSYKTYSCVKRGTCNLPITPLPGKSLIYLIRPSTIFNPAEKQQVFVTEDNNKERHISYITDSSYCAISVMPGETRLRVVGQINEDESKLVVHAGMVYYVIIDVNASIFSTKLNVSLRQASKEEGEMYLRNDVVGECGR
jgi:hypothetical protein